MRSFLKRSWILTVFLFFATAGCFYILQTNINLNYIPYTKRVTNPITESAVVSSTSYKHVTKSLSELGRTPELSDHIIFFNRVPKCGSEMLVLLMQWLQGSNNFRHVRLKGGNNRKLNRLEQEQLVDEVTDIIKNKAVPLSFDRHVYFINFTTFDRQSPKFVNLIRDPVDKLISRFYYKRVTPNPKNPDLKYAPQLKQLEEKLARESLEECVTQNLPECTFKNEMPYDLTIPYFCGQDEKCMLLNNKWALNNAKANVDRYFPVVGILEEINATLEVFEYTLPYFFKGIQQVYFKDLFQLHHNKNKQKPQVKDYIRNYFKNILIYEYDFYEWIKRRLFQQLQILYGHSHK